MAEDRPAVPRRRVVIVGGGFAGLACARAPAGAYVDVTLVDKRNHHLFQPLLYQVSIAAVSPAYNYFAHPEWAQRAPAPKTIADARTIRARLLGAFDAAERSDVPEARAALLTFVVVGGGQPVSRWPAR